MRCRRVRSFLSAYCRDELDSHKQFAMREHLADCDACRREEAVFRQMAETTRELPQMNIADDFNARLLNRIAKERFSETRSKAYLPRKAPSLFWRRVMPAVATTFVAVFVAVVALWPTHDGSTPVMMTDSGSLDDSYLTAQPVSNPNVTVNLRKDWSFGHQLAQTKRFNRISNAMTPATSSGVWKQSDGLNTMVSSKSNWSPYVINRYSVHPIVKVYVSPRSASERKGVDAY